MTSSPDSFGAPRGRLAAVLLAAMMAACGDGGTGPGEDGSVSLSSSSAALEALEATVDLDASATSSSGETLSDGDLEWSSTATSVATVNGVGLVTARGNGTARIVAALTAGGAADTADIMVDQQVVETRMSPSAASLPELGDTLRLSASPEDANGFRVEGVTVSWATTDSEVLEVDAEGLVTARDTGEAEVVATPAEGPEGRVPVEVARPDPVIEEVSPDTLVEGEAATITGQHFSSTPDENLVLVDTRPAVVTAASSTQLEITVPRFDCRPPRGVGLQVVTDDDSSGVAAATVRPDEAPVSLAVGERLLIGDPADGFCLRLDETDDSEEYLVGVQSVTDAVGPVSVHLALEAGGGSGSGSVAPSRAPGAGADRLGEGPGPGATMGPLEALAGASPEEARLREWERRHLGPRLSSSLPRRWGAGGPPRAEDSEGPALAAKIGSDPSEGDTLELRVPDLDAGEGENACTSFFEIQAVIRKTGTHGIWLEDVENPSDGFTDSDWREFSDKFDDFIYSTDTDYFGDPTDLDANERVAVVVTKELNELGNVLGFVFAGDLFPRSSDCASSDEGELTYTLAPDPDGVHGDTVEAEDLRHDYPRLLAHELTHIIQFGRRFECSDCDFPVAWITEGQATLAEEVVGHAATGRQTGQNYGIDAAFNPDDRDFTTWYRNRFVDMAVYYGFQSREEQLESAPHGCSWLEPEWAGPCLGTRGVYGVPSTLLRWINDHLGPDHPGGEQALQREITGNDDLGFDNVEEVTGESMESLLADWGPMLWTDDRVPGLPDRLTLPSWDLVDIFQNLVSTARLTPVQRSFTGFSDQVSVNAGSAVYYLVSGSARPQVALRARSPDGTVLPVFTQMWVVRTR